MARRPTGLLAWLVVWLCLCGPAGPGLGLEAGALPSSLYASGLRLVYARQHRRAIETLTAAVAGSGDALASDQWAYAYYVIGFSFDQLGRRSRAIECYERALMWAEPGSRQYGEFEAALLQRPVQ